MSTLGDTEAGRGATGSTDVRVFASKQATHATVGVDPEHEWCSLCSERAAGSVTKA